MARITSTQLCDILADTLRWLTLAVAGCTEAALRTQPAQGEWSAVEILAHLRACAEVFGGYVDRMLSEDAPELTYVHPNHVMKINGYAALSFAGNWQVFEHDRRALLSRLASLEPEDWQRSGRIKGRTHTVFGEVRRIALHESEHAAQFDKAVPR